MLCLLHVIIHACRTGRDWSLRVINSFCILPQSEVRFGKNNKQKKIKKKANNPKSKSPTRTTGMCTCFTCRLGVDIDTEHRADVVMLWLDSILHLKKKKKKGSGTQWEKTGCDGTWIYAWLGLPVCSLVWLWEEKWPHCLYSHHTFSRAVGQYVGPWERHWLLVKESAVTRHSAH